MRRRLRLQDTPAPSNTQPTSITGRIRKRVSSHPPTSDDTPDMMNVIFAAIAMKLSARAAIDRTETDELLAHRLVEWRQPADRQTVADRSARASRQRR